MTYIFMQGYGQYFPHRFKILTNTKMPLIRHEINTMYFNKYVNKHPRSIGEWFSIFFRDTSDTLNFFSNLQNSHSPLFESIKEYERNASEHRYFSDTGAWRYFRSAFAERVTEFKEEVEKTSQLILRILKKS